jgi:5'-nucleotidase
MMSEKDPHPMIKVLISNDDGIHALGIRTLVERLSLDYEVYVIAPDRERSATGHALTLHKPLRVDEINMGENVAKAYSVTGTPSDCIKIGLNAILESRPDVVVSGINHGPNLGADVLYSGTVSAALEGALNGLPSIAVSLLNGYDKNADFRPGADFIAGFIPQAVASNLPPRTIFNVNIPAVPITDMTGIKMTSLGVRMYTDTYEKRVDPRNQVYYWLAGEILDDTEEADDSDVVAMRNNMISITPVTFDMTHWKVLNEFRNKFEREMGTPVKTPEVS